MPKLIEHYTVKHAGGIVKRGRKPLRAGDPVPDNHFTQQELDAHLASGVLERHVREASPTEREVKAFLDKPDSKPAGGAKRTTKAKQSRSQSDQGKARKEAGERGD